VEEDLEWLTGEEEGGSSASIALFLLSLSLSLSLLYRSFLFSLFELAYSSP
jgi:hypothetical protein